MPLFNPVRRQLWAPSDNNLAGASGDSANGQGGLIWPTSGTLNFARVLVTSPLVTNILFHFTVAGATLTAGQCFAGLYTSAGVLIGTTADQAAAWVTGGLKTMALTVAQATTIDTFYYVAWYAVGTTMPTQTRLINSSSVITNVGLAAPNLRFGIADTGLTTALPDPMGTQTGGATAWWVGLS